LLEALAERDAWGILKPAVVVCTVLRDWEPKGPQRELVSISERVWLAQSEGLLGPYEVRNWFAPLQVESPESPEGLCVVWYPDEAHRGFVEEHHSDALAVVFPDWFRSEVLITRGPPPQKLPAHLGCIGAGEGFEAFLTRGEK